MDNLLISVGCVSCALLGYVVGWVFGYDKGWSDSSDSRKSATQSLEGRVESLIAERNDALNKRDKAEMYSKVALSRIEWACKELRKALQ